MKLVRLCVLPLFLSSGVSWGANSDGAEDLGVDYAYMVLMTLSPDFAAANYTITNESDLDVEISIGRLPFHFNLVEDARSRLQLEIALAYQRTTEIIPTSPAPGENIDAEWDTLGGGLGFLYEYDISNQWRFNPSFRIGIAKMENRSSYNGIFTNSVKDQFEGTVFNWDTHASIVNLGLGLSYDWKLIDRDSSIQVEAHHVLIDSHDESDPSLRFSEKANMVSVKADMVFPTDIDLSGERLDLVLLLGKVNFFGENRRTLGFTSSYRAGVGAEIPVRSGQEKHGYLRLSGQLLWADNMSGWMLTLGLIAE